MRLSTFKNPAITTFSQLSDALSSNNKYQIITIWKLQFLLILNVQILGNYKISRFTVIASQYSVEYKKHTEFVYQHYVPANVTVFIQCTYLYCIHVHVYKQYGMCGTEQLLPQYFNINQRILVLMCTSYTHHIQVCTYTVYRQCHIL